jgi:hypothetical protein
MRAISVVIPTFNRAALLQQALQSLAEQTIPVGDYEVVVVDDGSTDETSRVCEELSRRMHLSYHLQEHGGISVAKNAGIAIATAPIVLCFDDDDVADPTLLAEHLRTHREHPEDEVAVLGFTDWHHSLVRTPLMEWVTDIGQVLFAYQDIVDGSRLPFTYFWGGRTSCKTSMIMRHGGFDERFRFLEDIELGFRLSHYGLVVIFNRRAASYMIRPLDLPGMLRRCERAGESLALFSRTHAEPEVLDYCTALGVTLPWDDGVLRWQEARIAVLEAELGTSQDEAGRRDRLWELWDLYWWTLKSTTSRAFVKAGGHAGDQAGRDSAPDARARLDSARYRRSGELMSDVRTLRSAVAARDRHILALQAQHFQDASERDAALLATQDRLNATVSERDGTILALTAELHGKVSECNAVIRGLQEDLKAAVADRDRTILALRADLLEKLEARDTEIRRLQEQLELGRQR